MILGEKWTVFPGKAMGIDFQTGEAVRRSRIQNDIA